MELEIVDIKNIQWLGAGTWEMSANMTNTFQNEMKKGLAILFSKVTEQIGTPLLWGTATSTDAFLSPNLCGTASWDEGAGSTPHFHGPVEVLAYQGYSRTAVPGRPTLNLYEGQSHANSNTWMNCGHHQFLTGCTS